MNQKLLLQFMLIILGSMVFPSLYLAEILPEGRGGLIVSYIAVLAINILLITYLAKDKEDPRVFQNKVVLLLVFHNLFALVTVFLI